MNRTSEATAAATATPASVPPPAPAPSRKLTDPAFYLNRELSWLDFNRRVLVVAHGNSIRALVMYLEELTAKQILEREVATGVPIVYRLTENGQVAERHDLVA